MFKLIKNSIKNAIENQLDQISMEVEIQTYVYNVVKKMDENKDIMRWSSGYWQLYDEQSKVIPIADRSAYMKKGQSFKSGTVYKLGKPFQGEHSLGLDIGGIGSIYNLEHLKHPATYAVAKDKDSVMLFDWNNQ